MKQLCALVLGLLSIGVARAADTYAHPELLVEPATLSRAETAKKFVILDVRSDKKYAEGHIPGAHQIDHAAWVKAFGDGTDTAGWSKRLGELGIGPDTSVVLYDDTGVKDAAQIWWILRYWGIDARLLHGGWTGWKEGKYPQETTAGPAPKTVTPNLQAKQDRLATRAFVLASLRDKSQQLLDGRSEREFTGEDKLARRAGTIPGALNQDWTVLIDPKTQRFKSATELKRLFEEAGIQLDKPTVAFCQSGRRSSVTVFALELLGTKAVRNYFGSWAEWGNAEDTPIVIGKPRQK